VTNGAHISFRNGNGLPGWRAILSSGDGLVRPAIFGILLNSDVAMVLSKADLPRFIIHYFSGLLRSRQTLAGHFAPTLATSAIEAPRASAQGFSVNFVSTHTHTRTE